MKTESQIQAKIKEIEDHINALLSEELTDIAVMCIESYLIGRKALLWSLSDEPYITDDDFHRKAKYECMCFESTKIF
jgi:hypothetical protein